MIDLHVHTIYSDGEHSPREILDLCKKRGITVVGITDHNTVEGCKQTILENPYEDITIISGLELGAKYDVKGANLHILGYNVDLNNKPLNDICNAIMEDNVMRLKSIVELLKTYYGFIFKDQDLEEIYSSVGNIGRPDIARLCVEYGYAKDIEETFMKYLIPIDNKTAKRRAELTDKACIEYIRNAGGIPCLAHPIELKMDLDALKVYIKNLTNSGLEALEVYQSKHSKEYSEQLLKIANENKLLYSVGSDYHGPLITPDIELGFGRDNNLHMNEASILSKILR